MIQLNQFLQGTMRLWENISPTHEWFDSRHAANHVSEPLWRAMDILSALPLVWIWWVYVYILYTIWCRFDLIITITTHIHCAVLCIASVSSATSLQSTCQSISPLRFCLGNSLSNGSSYYDLLMHIWFLIDTTAVIEYGETLVFQCGSNMGMSQNRDARTYSFRLKTNIFEHRYFETFPYCSTDSLWLGMV